MKIGDKVYRKGQYYESDIEEEVITKIEEMKPGTLAYELGSHRYNGFCADELYSSKNQLIRYEISRWEDMLDDN